MRIKTRNIPTIFIIFGATGDLMERKIVPSLFYLFEKGKLPSMFKIFGFSKEKLDDASFNEKVFHFLTTQKRTNTKTCGPFCDIFSYHQGNFENKADYEKLAKKLKAIDDKWGVCSNKLFYFAVPPQFYEVIFNNLAESGLTTPCSPEEGWSRILVEKPFGKDLKTAESLDRLLEKLFKEVQIYRIDHYLAKEMIQNILTFRFSNNLFSENWDRNSIEKIEIRLHEKIGVEKRGAFYDGVGALQDVGQNHLLQMLALVAMDKPANFESASIRKKRADILNTLIPSSFEEIKHFTYRSQYESYPQIQGVNPQSTTETYFKIRAFLSSPRFSGVPIIIDSGKRLKEQVKEIEITFKHPIPCFCPPQAKEHYINRVVISLEPKEAITMQVWLKKPGLEFEMEKRTFEFLLRTEGEKLQYIEEYEKLLLDAIAGDQTLFVSTDEIKAMWRFIDPIAAAWKNNAVPLNVYKPDTQNPAVQSSFINEAIISYKDTKKEIGFIGLGKMGGNLAQRLLQRGWRVAGFDTSKEIIEKLEKESLQSAASPKELVQQASKPRIIWLMLPAFAPPSSKASDGHSKATAGRPAGDIIDGTLFGKEGIVQWLKKGDVIIDGGNSYYKDSVLRYKKLKKKGIHFLDAGVSGGPKGALEGASIMVGGSEKVFKALEPLFFDLAQKQGYQYMGEAGSGHFVKMIHNGIEYGMMQAIAEGFSILKKSKYSLNLTNIIGVYNHGSVIESKLLMWLYNGFEIYGQDLSDVSGSVSHTGEGAWTVKTAKELGLKAKVIEEALNFRIQSKHNPSYEGKVLSVLREQFGGHAAKK